jgi:hypothetical protein
MSVETSVGISDLEMDVFRLGRDELVAKADLRLWLEVGQSPSLPLSLISSRPCLARLLRPYPERSYSSEMSISLERPSITRLHGAAEMMHAAE